MSRPRLARLAAALAFGLAALAGAPAAADTAKLIATPAEKYLIAPGGVDMRTGRYAYSETDLTGGGEQGALALTRILPEAVGNHANPFGNFSHNWDIFLIEMVSRVPGDDTVRVNVHYGGRSLTFETRGSIEAGGYSFRSDGELAALTYTGLRSNGTAVHTMRAPDGTVLVFRPLGSATSADCADQAWGSSRRRCAFVSEMIQPDGTKYTFDYVAGAGSTGNRFRLARVVSSRGYALLLEGSGSLVTRACLFNLALGAAPAAGSACPAGALATATYGYSGGKLVSATPAGGGTSTFTYDSSGATMGFVKPGQSAPWLTNVSALVLDEEGAVQEAVGTQTFAGGQTYAYAYGQAPITNDQTQAPLPTAQYDPSIAGGSYTDAEGHESIVRFDWPLHPDSGPTEHCIHPPCEFDPPSDGFLNYIYQQTPGPVEITDPLGRTTTIDYCDPVATGGCSVVRMQSSTDPEGIRTKYEYDGRGNFRKATRYPKPGILNPDGSTPAPTVVEAEYDIFNPYAQTKPLWMKDANGNITHFTYAPEHGGVLTETGPAVNGVTPQKRYSYVQRQARVADGSPAGPAIWLLDRMSFCRSGNPSGAGCALGAADEVVTTYDYGPTTGPNILLLRGQAVSADGATLRTCFGYDGQGRKISETSPNAGLAACPASPPGAAATYTSSTRYDPDGRVTGTIGPDPDQSGPLGFPALRNSYDPAGLLIKVEEGALAAWQSEAVAPRDWTGFTVFRTVETAYDSMSRKVREAVKGADGATAGVTEYDYDLDGRVRCTAVRMNPDYWATPLENKCVPGPAHLVHGPDRIARNVHDEAGQLKEQWDGFGTSLQRREALYTYNGNGQKTSLTDARGYRAEMAYDGHGRQSRWLFPSRTSAGAADPNDFEYYLYDPNGNRTKLRKRDGSILTFQYDALNRMTAKLVPERANLTNAQTRDVYYDYDLRGLQTKARFDGLAGEGVTNAYDGFGRLVSSTLAMAGTSRTLSHLYDNDGNRIRIVHPDQAFMAYGYDWGNRPGSVYENGNVALAVFAYDPAGRRSGLTSGGTASRFRYDMAGRLDRITHNLAGATSDQAIGLSWNPAGQIAARTSSNNAFAWTGSVAVSRAYSANGQNQYLGTVSNDEPSATFAYDANGNLISDGTSNFLYDIENRLVSASGAKTATLVYDPLGRLFQTSGGAAGITQFLYDDDALIGEYDAAGTMTHRYVHGPAKGVDDPLVWYDQRPGGSWRRALVADQQGSIVAVAAADGTPLAVNAYDEYGIPKSTNVGRFQYTGQAWIPELGMYHYKARIYSPTLGRFLQTDPIGYDDQINLYAYVGSDPVNATDPTGQACYGTCPDIPDKVAIATDGYSYVSINVNSETADFWKGAIALGSFFTPAGEVKGVATAAEQAPGVAKGLAVAAARAEAGLARSQGKGTGASTGLVTAQGSVFTGRSTTARTSAQATHPRVQRALDSVPPKVQPEFHGCCGEVQVMSRALEAGEKLRGSVVATVRTATGKVMDACPSCQHVLKHFGVDWQRR